MPSKELCPCCSGRPYAGCCEPYHAGQREAPDAEALMRSRYAAFAKNQTPYLWRTLHPDHDDRARDRDEVMRALRETIRSLKYMGLAILDSRPPDADGVARVLFLARLFEKGRDRSFVELSAFAHDGEGWRYLSGELLPVSRLGPAPERLDIEAFLAALGGR